VDDHSRRVLHKSCGPRFEPHSSAPLMSFHGRSPTRLVNPFGSHLRVDSPQSGTDLCPQRSWVPAEQGIRAIAQSGMCRPGSCDPPMLHRSHRLTMAKQRSGYSRWWTSLKLTLSNGEPSSSQSAVARDRTQWASRVEIWRGDRPWSNGPAVFVRTTEAVVQLAGTSS
jgi:hypothetical protein